MFPKRVLITGASGFIGSRLCEVLWLSGACQARAFVHSTGSAARIARFPLEFFVGDLVNRRSVEGALEGCDAVVHLARGSTHVMNQGLENVLRAAARNGVSRFVHMSSVAVYGNEPPPQSVSEDAPARFTDLRYGNAKLAQEIRVRRHGRHGLPVVILRPPNVWGPFSLYTLTLLRMIRAGCMPIVDGGKNPCNLVYIDNLVQAVLLALWKAEAVGQTFFVTDRELVTWERCLQDHAAIQGCGVPHISSVDLVPPARERLVRDSLRALPGVVFSKDFRNVLRRIPVSRNLEQFVYQRFESLSASTKQNIRLWVYGPERCDTPSEPRFDASDNIIAAQARKVAHSSEKARKLLAYSAAVSYQEGMELTHEWLRASHMLS